MNKRRFRRRAPGFTLLEVLIALTIVGLGVVTLLQIFSLGLRLQSRSASQSEAVAHSTRIMDELLARKHLDGALNGRIGAEGRWSAEVRTVPEAPTTLALSRNWELREVALDLSLEGGATPRQVQLKTFRLARKGNP